MLPLLLAGCDLLAPAPEPLALSVGLPEAQHAGSAPARDFLHLAPRAQPTDAEHEALCAWMRGEAEDDRIAEKLQARGDMGFAVLEASGAQIRLGGAAVLSLTDGVIPEAERRGMMVTALYDTLIDHIETRKATAERCQIPREERTLPMLIAIDPGVPFETARQLIYTAGQAQVGAFYLMVSGPTGGALPRDAPADEDRQLTAAFQEDGGRIYTRASRPDHGEPIHSLTDAAPLLEGSPLGCGVIVPRLETPWSAVLSEMDAFAGQGASRFILASAPEEDAASTAAPPAPPAALALSLDASVPAFLMELPSIGPADPDADPHSGSECDPVVRAMVEVKRPEGLGAGNLLDALKNADLIGSGGLGEGLGGLGISGIGTSGGTAPGSYSDLVESATLTLGSATIDGPLRPDVVDRVVRKLSSQLRYCHQRQITRDGPLSGEMTVRFMVDSSGSVSQVGVTRDTVSTEVATCVKGRFSRLSFPRLPGNLTATVTIPLTFSLE